MRVLIATDGSQGAALATTVAARTPWPAGSTIRVVSVVHEGAAPAPHVWTPVAGDRPAELDEEAALRAARESIARSGVQIELRRGHPASEIVDAASEFEADLVVVGSRGLGPWATVLLGSVSAEVVDHAPCPVLVVRGPDLDPIIFAADGSEYADRAERFLVRWPRAETGPVHVVHVRPAGHATAREEVDDSRDPVASIAEEAAARLGKAGVPAEPVHLEGDPAHSLVEAARTSRAGLIVLGTHGRTGLTRIVMGSVARKVLTHAPCSVLVVRRATRRVPAPAAVPVAATGA